MILSIRENADLTIIISGTSMVEFYSCISLMNKLCKVSKVIPIIIIIMLKAELNLDLGISVVSLLFS